MEPRKLFNIVALAALLVAAPSLVHAQPAVDCDSIAIGNIRFSATDAGIIEVPAASINGACVDYPSFNLYDQNGDTLAAEIVNFFCLSFGPVLGIHTLNVLPGADLGSGPQLLTLELFGGFGAELVCTWDLMVDLCPPDSCVNAQLTFTDWHDQLQEAQVFWFLESASGATVGSGIFQLDGVNRNAVDSTCLVPGADYYLWVSPFTQINVFDSINLAVSSNQGITGLINFFQNDSVPSDVFFGWYEACAEITNSIQEADPVPFRAWQQGTYLVIDTEQNDRINEVRLLNMHGQALRSLTTTTTRMTVNVGDLAPGVYLVQVITGAGINTTQKVFIR